MNQDNAYPNRGEASPYPHRHALDIIPQSAGPRLATRAGGAIHSIRAPDEQTAEAGVHFAAVMLSPAPGNLAALGSDTLKAYDASPGALVIQPAGVQGRAIWSRRRENVIVAIRPESLLDLAAGEFDVGRVSLQPPAFGTVDQQAHHVAALLKAELTRQESASELYVDSLITLFGIHLLRNYAGIEKPLPASASGLSAHNARRVQEFLRENFSRKLTVAEIAAVTGLSPFHFIRAFGKTFGQPPHQYVLGLRLAFAEKLLLESNFPIAEIAHVSGFSSQSHLAATMKKYRHMTPAEIRRRR